MLDLLTSDFMRRWMGMFLFFIAALTGVGVTACGFLLGLAVSPWYFGLALIGVLLFTAAISA